MVYEEVHGAGASSMGFSFSGFALAVNLITDQGISEPASANNPKDLLIDPPTVLFEP